MIFNTDNFIDNPTRVKYVKYLLNLLSIFFNERLYVWLPEHQSFRISWKDSMPTEIYFEWQTDDDENIKINIHAYDAQLLVGDNGSTISALKKFIYTQKGTIEYDLRLDFNIIREIHDPFEIALQLLNGDEESFVDDWDEGNRESKVFLSSSKTVESVKDTV